MSAKNFTQYAGSRRVLTSPALRVCVSCTPPLFLGGIGPFPLRLSVSLSLPISYQMPLVVHAGFVLFAGVDPQGHPAFMLLSWEEEPSTPKTHSSTCRRSRKKAGEEGQQSRTKWIRESVGGVASTNNPRVSLDLATSRKREHDQNMGQGRGERARAHRERTKRATPRHTCWRSGAAGTASDAALEASIA